MKKIKKPKLGMRVTGETDLGVKFIGTVTKIENKETIYIDVKTIPDGRIWNSWCSQKRSDGFFGADLYFGYLYKVTFKSEVMGD